MKRPPGRSIQWEERFALTPALSPEERETDFRRGRSLAFRRVLPTWKKPLALSMNLKVCLLIINMLRILRFMERASTVQTMPIRHTRWGVSKPRKRISKASEAAPRSRRNWAVSGR